MYARPTRKESATTTWVLFLVVLTVAIAYGVKATTAHVQSVMRTATTAMTNQEG